MVYYTQEVLDSNVDGGIGFGFLYGLIYLTTIYCLRNIIFVLELPI